jgi:outer membrane protein OmpA-like peptidoglycan-associated protein
LILGAGLITATPGLAQNLGTEVRILDLKPTVLDLSATVSDMIGESRDISAKAQETLQRSGDISWRQSGDNFILSVASDVLFDFDSVALSPRAQRSLTDMAELITRAPKGQILVVGHTDSKGSNHYNLDLSERRAKAVAAFLRNQGVASGRLRTEGRGKTEPVADNEVGGVDHPEGRAKNRRVEFVVPKSMLQD